MSVQIRSTRKKRIQTYIIFGDGFDELEVVSFLHKFRREGIGIKSVSLFHKLVVSCQGVALKADYALAELPLDPEGHYLFILPSGGRNGDVLRKDARVKALLAGVNPGNCNVVVTDGRSHLARDVDNLLASPTAWQPPLGLEIADLVDALADQVAFAV